MMAQLALQALAMNAERACSEAHVAVAVGEHARDVLPLDLVEREEIRGERRTAFEASEELARRDILGGAVSLLVPKSFELMSEEDLRAYADAVWIGYFGVQVVLLTLFGSWITGLPALIVRKEVRAREIDIQAFD